MNFGRRLIRSHRKRWECRGVRAMLAEQSSRSVMRPTIRDYKQRQVPAKTFNAVPIRGYQSGQPPCPLARTPQHFHLLRGPPWTRALDRTFHIKGSGAQPRAAQRNIQIPPNAWAPLVGCSGMLARGPLSG